MSKRTPGSGVLFSILVYSILVVLSGLSPRAIGDIFTWEYIDPSNPALGKKQSTTLAPQGAGVSAVPNANLNNRNLTKAYLINANLTSALLRNSNLQTADFSNANLTSASLGGATLTNANLSGATIAGSQLNESISRGFTQGQLYSTLSYQNRNLQGIGLGSNAMNGWNFVQQNLASAYLGHSSLIGTDFSNANLSLAGFAFANLSNANLQGANLTSAGFEGTSLINANFNNADLSGAVFSGTGGSASLSGANLSGAKVNGTNFIRTDLTIAQLSATSSYQNHDLSGIKLTLDFNGFDLSNQNLTSALVSGNFSFANLTGANISGATFVVTPGLTKAQLSSTSSYQNHDLAGVKLINVDLAGWDLSNQDLRNASLSESRVNGVRFSGARIEGANFAASYGLTPAHIYATASYQSQNLQGVDFQMGNLQFFDLSNQNLASANVMNAILRFSDFSRAYLENTNFVAAVLEDANFSGAYLNGANFKSAHLDNAIFTAADFRGVLNLTTDPWRNSIRSDATIDGLDLQDSETLIVRDHTSATLTGIRMMNGMHISPGGELSIRLQDATWGSTIRFDPGIDVQLGGTLRLGFQPGFDPSGLVGTSWQLFDWTGVAPTGSFSILSGNPDLLWDTSNLYTTGFVTLQAVPEPASLVLMGLLLPPLASRLNRRSMRL